MQFCAFVLLLLLPRVRGLDISSTTTISGVETFTEPISVASGAALVIEGASSFIFEDDITNDGTLTILCDQDTGSNALQFASTLTITNNGKFYIKNIQPEGAADTYVLAPENLYNNGDFSIIFHFPYSFPDVIQNFTLAPRNLINKGTLDYSLDDMFYPSFLYLGGSQSRIVNDGVISTFGGDGLLDSPGFTDNSMFGIEFESPIEGSGTIKGTGAWIGINSSGLDSQFLDLDDSILYVRDLDQDANFVYMTSSGAIFAWESSVSNTPVVVDYTIYLVNDDKNISFTNVCKSWSHDPTIGTLQYYPQTQAWMNDWVTVGPMARVYGYDVCYYDSSPYLTTRTLTLSSKTAAETDFLFFYSTTSNYRIVTGTSTSTVFFTVPTPFTTTVTNNFTTEVELISFFATAQSDGSLGTGTTSIVLTAKSSTISTTTSTTTSTASVSTPTTTTYTTTLVGSDSATTPEVVIVIVTPFTSSSTQHVSSSILSSITFARNSSSSSVRSSTSNKSIYVTSSFSNITSTISSSINTTSASVSTLHSSIETYSLSSSRVGNASVSSLSSTSQSFFRTSSSSSSKITNKSSKVTLSVSSSGAVTPSVTTFHTTVAGSVNAVTTSTYTTVVTLSNGFATSEIYVVVYTPVQSRTASPVASSFNVSSSEMSSIIRSKDTSIQSGLPSDLLTTSYTTLTNTVTSLTTSTYTTFVKCSNGAVSSAVIVVAEVPTSKSSRVVASRVYSNTTLPSGYASSIAPGAVFSSKSVETISAASKSSRIVSRSNAVVASTNSASNDIQKETATSPISGTAGEKRYSSKSDSSVALLTSSGAIVQPLQSSQTTPASYTASTPLIPVVTVSPSSGDVIISSYEGSGSVLIPKWILLSLLTGFIFTVI